MSHFMFKLIAPRPTFATDMNEEERKLMLQHAIFWNDLLAKGTALVYGPVLDPKGTYGLAIIEADNEADAQAICTRDPTIKASLHTYELHPMQVFIGNLAS
jgi:uncharacterized protein YciI